MDGGLDGGDAALRVLLRGAHRFLGDVDLLHHDALLLRERTQDDAFLALVLAGQDAHLVTLFHMHAIHLRTPPYSVSGARDTIFIYFLSRSSRATGPKMRVPRGAPFASMSTAAFWSNLM